MKNYTLLNAVTSATDGPAYVMKWERGQIFSLAVSGEFTASVKIYGYAGDAWFPVPLIDLAKSKKITEISEPGYYAVLIPKLYSRIKAVTDSYTSGAVTVVGTQTEGTLGVLAAALASGGSGGSVVYEVGDLSYNGTKKKLAEFETTAEAETFIKDFFKKYNSIHANITDFPVFGTVSMVLHSNGTTGYFTIAPFVVNLLVGYTSIEYDAGGIGYEVTATFSIFNVEPVE